MVRRRRAALGQVQAWQQGPRWRQELQLQGTVGRPCWPPSTSVWETSFPIFYILSPHFEDRTLKYKAMAQSAPC